MECVESQEEIATTSVAKSYPRLFPKRGKMGLKWARRSLLLATMILMVLASTARAEGETTQTGDESQDTSLKSTEEDHHKDFWPLDPIEYLATVLLIAITVLTNAAGIGGGGALVPILLLYGFKTNVAVALSNAVIFCGGITKFIFEFSGSHPLKKARLVNYNIVALMLPAVMIGSFVGAQLNVITPSVIILFSLGAVLVFVSFKSLKKANSLYKRDKEKEDDSEQELAVELVEVKDQENRQSEEDSWNHSVAYQEDDSFITRNLKNIKRAERTHFHLPKMALILSCLTILLIVALIRKKIISVPGFAFEKCSLKDLVLCSFFICSMIVILIGSIKILKDDYELKKKVNYEFVEGDIQWENKAIFAMSAVAIIGGGLSSLVGLGGGVIFGPLMMEFGVHPKITSVTSMYLIMISTFAATFQFLLMGVMPLDYAVILGLMIVVFVVLGNMFVNKIVEKIGKPSVLALFLAYVIILCTIIVLFTGAFKMYDKISKGENVLASSPYCDM
ncbi:unnamed protein product [Moneuplotes crassus]|uniref:Sulfite exporter TauE/SafE family protein n=1 Tax=Euplotes crassus TaxID=5936 RepID=A0AAD1U293_EUPCR|nr:unnamed protein product [Moneuplotes crassus]